MKLTRCFSYLLLSTTILSCVSSVHASNNNNLMGEENTYIFSPSSFSKSISETKVHSHLTKFGFAEEKITELLKSGRQWIDDQQMVRPSAYLKARALWQIDQELLRSNNSSPSSFYTLNPQEIAACMLYKSFSLSKKKLSPATLQQVLSLIGQNPYLTHLDFFQCDIQDEAIKYFSNLTQITHLSLEENNITDEGVAVFASHPSLVSLKLWKNKIGPKGAQLLAQNQKLEELGLYKNKVGDEGALALSTHPHLKILDLRENDITNTGAKALAQNKILDSLRLRYNHITDEGASAFLDNRHLSSLEIAKNAVSEDLVFTLENLARSNAYLQLVEQLDPNASAALNVPAKKHVHILSIDGGGIRGLLPALILEYMGQRISQVIGTPFHWAKHMDLMSGTSTGALICLGLALPDEKYTPQYLPQTLVDLYQKEGKNIFPKHWNLLKKVYDAKYDPQPLEKMLESYFKDKPFSSSLSHLLITSYDLQQQQAYIFDSHAAKKAPEQDFLMRSVGRATSAAPTYFPAAEIKNNSGTLHTFVDGGIYANNPTLLALKKAKQLYPQAEKYTVISLGTGSADKKSLASLKQGGLVQWGPQIPGVLMDNAADYTEKLMAAECEQDQRIHYIRIQPSLGESQSDLDDVRTQNITFLEAAAKQALSDHQSGINQLIQTFVKSYGQR